jgi:hypothetical protein
MAVGHRHRPVLHSTAPARTPLGNERAAQLDDGSKPILLPRRVAGTMYLFAQTNRCPDTDVVESQHPSANRLSPTDQLLALCQPVKAVGKMLLRRPDRRPASGNKRLGSGDFGFDLFPLRAECFARG